MLFDITDFNNSTPYFDREGKSDWEELKSVILKMPVYLQASQQAGISGSAIFDPKATNAHLSNTLKKKGWIRVPVPPSLQEFGLDWDGGKGTTLAEWQFSNYPFLWNNVIRTEAVVKSKLELENFGIAKALIVVTKSGIFPSSNSTLYYEQARAQLSTVTRLGAFNLPIRLVGLTVPADAAEIDAIWSSYPGRYSRVAKSCERRFSLKWGRIRQHGHRAVSFVATDRKK